MKRLLLLLAGLLCCAAAGAQDIILLRNADEVKAEVTEITDDAVLYKVWQGDGKVLSLSRGAVFSITYANGERELFTDSKTTSAKTSLAAYPWPKVTRSYQPGDLFDEDGVRGLVISVTDGGRHGLILSFEQADLPWVGEANSTALAGTQIVEGGFFTVTVRYDGGVVFGLTDRKDGWNNRTRLIECLASTGFSISDFPAFEWCETLGSGWYLPAAEELKGLWQLMGGTAGVAKIRVGDFMLLINRFNAYMEGNGGVKYPVRSPFLWFWSSTEKDAARIFLCDWECEPDVVVSAYRKTYGEIHTAGYWKADKISVRAVHKF